LRKSTNWEKNGDFFLIITYLFAEIVIKNKKYRVVVIMKFYNSLLKNKV
jgi:hypothetical protein